VTAHQTDPVTFVLIVRIPAEGIEHFRAYEDAVLPLLPEFNGRLERRLRNPDGTMEMHIVSFASDADFQNYRNDPRRKAQAWLLEKSSAKLELLRMADVSRLP
jgi:antibiotic biosynthesis monooxygenase (ABM) superfamily enzyme